MAGLRKTAVAGAALAVSALLVAGCGGEDGATAGGTLVGVDYPRSDSDFWNSYIKYVPQYGKELGLDLKTTNSENDIAKLAANTQALIGQGVKGVVFAPQDTAAVAPTLGQLAQKKIPVVTVDTRPDTGDAVVGDDGIPEELKAIAAGQIDATVSQPARRATVGGTAGRHPSPGAG